SGLGGDVDDAATSACAVQGCCCCALDDFDALDVVRVEVWQCAVQDHAVDHVDGALATVGGVDGARTTKHHGRCRTWASAGRDDVGPGDLALQLGHRVRAGHRHEAGVNPRNREGHLYRLSSLGHTRNHHFPQPHHVCAK